LPSCSLRSRGRQQGDQIGRIFAGWAIVFFGQFFSKIMKAAQSFGPFFPHFRLYIRFGKKRLGLHFGRFFHKLIWSPWSTDNHFCLPTT
jgi:hypothetical protein